MSPVYFHFKCGVITDRRLIFKHLSVSGTELFIHVVEIYIGVSAVDQGFLPVCLAHLDRPDILI